jgi:hypothetical protein
LLKDALKISAGITLSGSVLSFAEADSPIPLSLGKTKPVSIPRNFIGLGYEMSSVAPLGLLSAQNHPYVELVKRLGPAGVLRVGGIVANYTKYEPNGTIKADRQDTVITRASLEQFSGFLRKTGWQAIWSVNFAQGTIEEAVAEAAAVKSVLGPRLLALEIGNEIENYFRGQKPFRKAPYEYETYRKEYDEWHDAIVKAVPGVSFAAPDTASNIEWVERMAKDAHGDVQLLTTHYYRTGQNRGSADQLLHPDPRLLDVLARLRTASAQSGIPWRMCETSSFSGGGLRGVSDTMIGALWTLDYMLLLEQYGCAGVNIETGVNQLGFISRYSPIQDDGYGLNSAGVPYYGMLAFVEAHRGCTEAMQIEVPESTAGVTAYGLGTEGKVRCAVLVNRGESDHQLSLAGLGLDHHVTAMRLLAPAPDSKTGVTFAGASVDASGKWKASKVERGTGTSIALPRMSAVVVRS